MGSDPSARSATGAADAWGQARLWTLGGASAAVIAALAGPLAGALGLSPCCAQRLVAEQLEELLAGGSAPLAIGLGAALAGLRGAGLPSCNARRAPPPPPPEGPDAP